MDLEDVILQGQKVCIRKHQDMPFLLYLTYKNLKNDLSWDMLLKMNYHKHFLVSKSDTVCLMT